jgi:hypothetical protein
LDIGLGAACVHSCLQFCGCGQAIRVCVDVSAHACVRSVARVLLVEVAAVCVDRAMFTLMPTAWWLELFRIRPGLGRIEVLRIRPVPKTMNAKRRCSGRGSPRAAYRIYRCGNDATKYGLVRNNFLESCLTPRGVNLLGLSAAAARLQFPGIELVLPRGS